MYRMISVCFQGKPFNITVIQVYDPTINAKEAEVDQFHENLEDLLADSLQDEVLTWVYSPGWWCWGWIVFMWLDCVHLALPILMALTL